MQPRALKKPPIREAAFDIRATLGEGAELSDLEKFASQVTADFPNKEVEIDLSSNFELSSKDSIPKMVELETRESGFLFRDKDNTKVLQARLDGFTFSSINKYEGWVKFSESAYDFWNRYREASRPSEVSRLALRFINLIEIPINLDQIVDISQYMRVFPYLSGELGIVLEQSTLKIQILHEDFLPAKSILSQDVSSKEKEDQVLLQVRLDIDVYEEVDFTAYQDKDIRETFERLQRFKNKIFFDSISEKMIEVIDG